MKKSKKQMTKRERIVAAAQEVGTATQAEYVAKALAHYKDIDLTRDAVEALYMEAGFDYSLADVMGRAQLNLSPALVKHYRKEGL